MRPVAVRPTARGAAPGHLRRWNGCPIHPRRDIHPQLEGDLEDDEK